MVKANKSGPRTRITASRARRKQKELAENQAKLPKNEIDPAIKAELNRARLARRQRNKLKKKSEKAGIASSSGSSISDEEVHKFSRHSPLKKGIVFHLPHKSPMEDSSAEEHADTASSSENPEVVSVTSPDSKASANAIEVNLNGIEQFQEWVPQYPPTYGYLSLFRFASIIDCILMAIGTVAALFAGVCIPAVIYFFGDLVRTKVLVEKMECESGTSGCDSFLAVCEENLKDHSSYTDRVFLTRPLPFDKKINKKITVDHMTQFIDYQLIATFVYALTSSIYFFCWNYAGQNQGGKLRRAYFQSLLQKDLTWFETQEDPDTINRMMENTRFVVDVIGESIPVAISLTLMCILCVVLSFFHGWQLTLISLGTLPPLLFSLWLVNKLAALRLLKERRAYRLAHELAKDVFSKMRTVIVYGTQAIERYFYKREMARGNRYVIWAIFVKSVSVAIMYAVSFGMWALVFWYGMHLVMESAPKICSDQTQPRFYDAGDLFIVTMSILLGCSNVYIIATIINAAKVARLCMKQVLKVIDAGNGLDNMDESGLFLEEPMVGKVEFINVRFTYPKTKRGLVLNNLSFKAEPNSTIAIVGVSDSGKSTVLKLICKEYLADSGFVEIDGNNIRELNNNFLRSNIGYIPQDVTLFDMSIEDNVRMGKLDADFFQIQEACITAGAHDFIISFKEGYQTKIGHKGNRLTPGQKQLLTIARAILRDPKILLLDEPTNNLNEHSVADFMRTLHRISRNRTVILVAHRLPTVVHADRIYVLRNGRVVEVGDHHKLIKNKGPYSQLAVSNRASNSYHPGSANIDGFDTSELTLISNVKTFNQKPVLPNLYNNMLCIDPIVSKVTFAILESDNDTERGFHAKLEWSLKDFDDKTRAKNTQEEEDALHRELQENPPARSGNEQTEIQNESNGENNGDSVSNRGSLTSKSKIIDEYRNISLMTSGKRAWLRVLSMGSTSPILISIGIFATILLSIGVPVFGFLFALIIDVLSDMGSFPKHWVWAKYFDKEYSFPDMIVLSIAALGLYLGFFGFVQDFCLNLAAYESVQKMRRLLYNCILKQDMSFFEDPQNTPSNLASILFQDANSIRYVSYGVYATLLQCIFMLLTVIVLCSLHALKLVGYTLLFVLIVVIITAFDGWIAKKQHGKTINALQEMSKLILQVYQSKHVITICQMEPYYLKEFTSLQREALGSNKSMTCIRVFTYGLAQSAVFWGFGLFMASGKTSISGEGHNFLDSMINGFVVIFGLLTLGTNLSTVIGFKHITQGGKRMLEIINRTPLMTQDEEHDLIITEEDCNNLIEFVNVKFWRPQTPDSPLLKGVNLSIPPRQVTAIVGYPESGKSAFMELIGRYYDATYGMVTLAGKDISYFSAPSFREHLSVIEKEPELFTRTVAQNIAMGAVFRHPTMEDVIQAAKEANCHNLIVSLPEGYETRIGGEHDFLSNAQKQKISIARALLKNPKILICNEITTLLDKDGEKAVLESINMIQANRTLILISHRIQPVQEANWIVVMEKGYVEEQGQHADLLGRSNGIYANMWRTQNPMQDENFIKGTRLELSRLQSAGSPADPSQETGQDYPNDDEPPESSSGWGCFSFLGVVDPADVEGDGEFKEKN